MTSPPRTCPNICAPSWPLSLGVVATDTGYGWLLWVPTHLDDHITRFPDIPPEVLAVQRYAHTLGCAYVLFDNSVEPDPELPVWDW